MSRPVYSQHLFSDTLAPGFPFEYTVPDGFVAVVKDIAAIVFNGGSSLVAELSAVASSGTFFYRKCPEFSNRQYHSRGSWVVENGQVIAVSYVAASIIHNEANITMSGYLLALP